jgi:hypothetical protein
MTKAKLSIHQAAAALLAHLAPPRGAITTMVDIDERKGEVIRVLVSPVYRRSLRGVPSTFMGYPVVVEAQPRVHALGSPR